MDNFTVVEPIINFQKVRYDKLKEIIEPGLIKDKTINIYINFNSILEYFYAPRVVEAMNSLESKDHLIFVSEFINLMAHYRHYFYSRHKCSTRFFVYFLNKEPYGDKHYMQSMLHMRSHNHIKTGTMNEVLDININMIDTICKYLSNIYFIKSEGLDHSTIPYYILSKLSKRENEFNIIMTHDYFDYQLLNFPRTVVLSASGDRSKIYKRENIYDKKLKGLKYELRNQLSPELFTLIMTFMGNKERDIEKIGNYGFAKIIKKLDEFIDSGLIKNGYNFNLDYLSKLFGIVDTRILERNFGFCDLRIRNKIISEAKENIIKSKLINLRDNNTIMELNSKYFQFNNIQLIELEEGESFGE
jgi:hypothetical protein